MKNIARLFIASTFLFGGSTAIAQTNRTLVPVIADDGNQQVEEPSFLKGLLGQLDQSSMMIGEAQAPINPTPQQITNATQITCPPNRAGLTDGWDVFAYSLDRNAAISLNLYASAQISASDKVILYQWMWYKDIISGEGAVVGRCASGISLALKVRNLAADASLSLPFIAAKAQLGQAEVEYRLGTFGVSGNPINAAVPTASRVGQFNAQSYAELLSSIDKVQAAGNAGTGVTFTPRVVAVTSNVANANLSRQLLVQTKALSQISDAKTCSQAKASVPGRDGSTDGLVEEVYHLVVGATACTGNQKPSNAIRDQARADLTAFNLTVS